MQTVTVIAGSGWYGETLTKAGFLMEPNAYLSWIPTMNAAAALIDSAGNLTTTDNWRRYE